MKRLIFLSAIWLLLNLCTAFLPSSARAEFKDNGDGTVIDTATGFIWQQSDDVTLRNWKDALSYCEKLKLAGYSNWKLPNIRELETLIDRTRTYPALDPAFDIHSNTSYWSSTPLARSPSAGLIVSFDKGTVWANSESVFSTTHYVRCMHVDNADLTIKSITVPAKGKIGGTLQVVTTVRNGGEGAAGPFMVGLFLCSSKSIAPTSARLVGGYNAANGLARGKTCTNTSIVIIPKDISAGKYYLAAVVDLLGNVAEGSESNDTKYSTSQISITK